MKELPSTATASDCVVVGGPSRRTTKRGYTVGEAIAPTGRALARLSHKENGAVSVGTGDRKGRPYGVPVASPGSW